VAKGENIMQATKSRENFAYPLTRFLTTIATRVVSTIVFGFVLMTLWAWFVVPAFNLPELTIVSAIGLGLIVAFTTHQNKKEDFYSDDNSAESGSLEKTFKDFGIRLFIHGFFLFFGFIVHLFM